VFIVSVKRFMLVGGPDQLQRHRPAHRLDLLVRAARRAPAEARRISL